MPSARGDPVKPTASRWRSRLCTAGVHGPALRRTVSPTRTTVLVLPPSRGISGYVTGETLREPCTRRPSRSQSVPVVTEECVNECLRLEWCQVVGAFAETDELHGNAEFALHGDDDATQTRHSRE